MVLYFMFLLLQMQLVIYGKEDLVKLSQYTVSMFSSIRNNNASRVRYLNTSFSAPFNGKIVYYVPVADVHMITMYWQVMPLKEKYREKVEKEREREEEREREGERGGREREGERGGR